MSPVRITLMSNASGSWAVLGRFLQQTALLRRKGPNEIVHRGVLQAQLLQDGHGNFPVHGIIFHQ